MTCIIGYIDKEQDKIFIGADSAGVSSSSLSIRKDPKVFIRDGYIFGFTSSFRMGQLLMSKKLVLPKFKKIEGEGEPDLFLFMIDEFIPIIRSFFKENGFSRIESNEESGGVFLVGFKNKLFKIEGDFQICENLVCYDACGCGAELALGCISGIESLKQSFKISVEFIINKALEVSEQWNSAVRGPFLIKSINIV